MERVVSSVALLGTMTLCYLAGHLYYSLLLIAFGFKCYFEIVNINRNERKDSKNTLISFIEICPPFIQFFWLLPKTFVRRILVENDSLINLKEDLPIVYSILFVHHTAISAFLLLAFGVVFTLSLRKGQYRYQFKRIGWITLAAIVPISSPMFLSYYVYKGYFWMILCNGSVMINDIMAYVFGKTFGKTSLIKLSPNKTWEGFIGGGISTIVFSVFIAGYLSNYHSITCPMNEIVIKPFEKIHCDRPLMFDKKLYDFPIGKFVGLGQIEISPA